MPSLRRALLIPLAAVAALIAATPAYGTLLLRSDGAGLAIQDKNNFNDSVLLRDLDNGKFEIYNGNAPFEFFPFDFQAGCRGRGHAFAECDRFQPKVNIALAGGNDRLDISLDTPADVSLSANVGDDVVNGQAGKDFLDGGDGFDQLDGREGNDILEGEDGNDVVTGGLGVDTLRGNPGSDTIKAREPSGEGVADEIGCGGGNDFLEADSKDVVPASCERFDRSPVGETPHVSILGRTLRVSRTGRTRVRLRCPRGVGSLGCKGSLQARLAGGSRSSRSRKVRYSIAAGRRKTVTLRLSAADVRRLRARRGARGVVTSVEKGRKGPKTTVRRPRLRLG